MKILGLISGTEGYGVRRAWLGLSSQFRQKNVDIYFASVNEGDLANELKQNDFEVNILLKEKLKNIKSGKMKFFFLIYRILLQIIIIPKLIKVIRKNKVEVVLFRSPLEVILMGIVSKLTGINSYWLMPNSVSNNYPLDLNRRIYKFIFKYCKVIPIANSQYTLSTLGQVQNGNYTYLGIDPDSFVYSEEKNKLYRSKFKLKDDDILIGIFARMTPEKGQGLMIDTIQSLGEKAYNLHLLLCGAGTDKIYHEEIKDKIKKYGLSDRVHLVGAVSNVTDYYSACDIVANTRLDAEPFGFSVIEAMMMGIPVLAHKLGGPGETVINGVTGWHIPHPTKEGFTEGLCNALHSKKEWNKFSLNSKDIALKKYTSQAMVDNILNIINKDLNKE